MNATKLRNVIVMIYLGIVGGSTGVLAKLAFPLFSPMQLLFMRLAITVIFFGCIFLYQKRLQSVLRVVWASRLIFLILTMSGVGAGMMLGMLGLHATTAINYDLLFNMGAVAMVCFGVFLLHDALRPHDYVLLFLALVGASFIAIGNSEGWGLSMNYGDVLVVIAAIGWAWYSIYGPYVQRKNVELDGATVVFGSCMFGAILLTPYIFIFEPFSYHAVPSGAGLQAIVAAALLAIFATAVSFYLWLEFIAAKGGMLGGLIALSENIGGVVFPILILGEQLTLRVAVGGLLIISAIVVHEWQGD